MWKILFIVHLHVVIGGCQLIRVPSNNALIVGQRLEMICQPESNYIVREWTNQRNLYSNQRKIYSNWSYPRIIDIKNRFGYDIENDNAVVIYLNSTELDDSGCYNCSVQQGTKQLDHYSAQLIVFETEPICEDRITTAYNDTLEEGSVYWVRCSLNFSGSLTPTMEWRQHGGDWEMGEHGRIITDVVETIVIPNVRISSTLTVVINSTYNTTFYSCKTYFQSDNTSIQDTTAKNAPDYIYTWNSSVIIVAVTTFQEGTSSASTSIITSENESTFTSPFNAIYLVAGVAILFGIASSLVAIFLCLSLKRKSSAALANIDPREPKESEYDLIPYACTDGYDTIEEVKEIDDNLFTAFAPRMGPLPTPGYSSLMLDESKPPGVYSRMEHSENSVDDKERGVDGENLKSNVHGSTSNYTELSDVEGSSRKAALLPSAYLALETKVYKDENENIPSAYLTLSHSSSQLINNNVIENIQGDHSSRKPTLGSNSYLALTVEPVEDIADESEEIPSAYLKITD